MLATRRTAPMMPAGSATTTAMGTGIAVSSPRGDGLDECGIVVVAVPASLGPVDDPRQHGGNAHPERDRAAEGDQVAAEQKHVDRHGERRGVGVQGRTSSPARRTMRLLDPRWARTPGHRPMHVERSRVRPSVPIDPPWFDAPDIEDSTVCPFVTIAVRQRSLTSDTDLPRQLSVSSSVFPHAGHAALRADRFRSAGLCVQNRIRRLDGVQGFPRGPEYGAGDALRRGTRLSPIFSPRVPEVTDVHVACRAGPAGQDHVPAAGAEALRQGRAAVVGRHDRRPRRAGAGGRSPRGGRTGTSLRWGQRRCMASTLVGLKTIPAVVSDRAHHRGRGDRDPPDRKRGAGGTSATRAGLRPRPDDAGGEADRVRGRQAGGDEPRLGDEVAEPVEAPAGAARTRRRRPHPPRRPATPSRRWTTETSSCNWGRRPPRGS